MAGCQVPVGRAFQAEEQVEYEHEYGGKDAHEDCHAERRCDAFQASLNLRGNHDWKIPQEETVGS